MPTRVALCKVSVVGDNPAPFSDPIVVKVVLEIFECPPMHEIDVKFTWKPIWDFPVDQELDEFEVGPLTTVGKHELLLQSDPPNVSEIPDPTGPTALIISFSYRGQQFLHIGYNAVVTCEGEIPDVFEDATLLRRNLTQSFPKETAIAWDDKREKDKAAERCSDLGSGTPSENSSTASRDDDELQPKKRNKCE
ncbi:putative ASF1 like histone chaperone [Trypanosoma vivax]|uniref:Anti-silencing protein a-like protein n=1 Tax=Trypanosoma vivax (strain Y486) TaxID=1055687 RepID=G0U1H7_TRYVY|nr:hypothetical protein TRVL_00753 [Trypanosoma vivax]KAH8608815.1 putative ASF1 like histone chaperone [Trypanosoma vivax]CCC49934.1 conserved hypothetical protein [Trypanosoma vivax Y486]